MLVLLQQISPKSLNKVKSALRNGQILEGSTSIGQKGNKYINIMKKILFVLGFVFTALLAVAQVDTFSVRDMPGDYYLEDWPDYDYFHSYIDIDSSQRGILEHPGASICIGGSELYEGFAFWDVRLIDNFAAWNLWGRDHIHKFAVGKHAYTPIRVAGIGMFYPRYPYTPTSHLMRDAWLANDMDAIVLQLMDTGMNVLAEGSSMLADSVGKPLFVLNRHRNDEVYPGWGGEYSLTHDVYEAFFDTAITVTDSFYLAVHLESFSHEGSDYGFALPGLYEYHRSLNGSELEFIAPPVTWLAQGGFRYGSDGYHIPVPDNEWFTQEPCRYAYGYILIFPILEVICEEPDSVVWSPMGSGHVWVRWASGQWNSDWEVCYGPTGTLPGEGIVLQTATPSLILNDISIDTDYVVYVRSLCTVRDTVWSEWSTGTPFTLRDQNIEAISDADLTLVPNPTSGAVLLTTEAELTGVEVYTAAGVPFLRLPATGRTVRFDTSTWPAGTYLLTVSTSQGIVTRRLTVTR